MSRSILAAAWRRLPERLRVPGQFLGRHYAGCGATVGLMPRCDFACSGCYLGPGANAVPPVPASETRAQMRRIREWLGPGGNIQITDGEATLLPEERLIEHIAYARAIGLVPMLMTHGESFRRRPGLLERLMERGGLTEVSIHIDTTMRGRPRPFDRPRSEEDLHALREEFAAMIAAARRRSGRRLEAASTVTVTRDSLADVASIVRWFLRHGDAFKMVSFQPAAQVGRTRPGLGGAVTAEELWDSIAAGTGMPRRELERGIGWLGHPGCSRFAQGIVVRREGRAPQFHSLYRRDEPREARFLERWLERFGGTTFRLDGRARAVLRAAGLTAAHAGFLASEAIPAAWHLAARAAGGRTLALLRDIITGRARVAYTNLVSHHFMSAEEMSTPLGRERLGLCVFQAPVNGRMMPMCEVNAGGGRERVYSPVPESLSVQS